MKIIEKPQTVYEYKMSITCCHELFIQFGCSVSSFMFSESTGKIYVTSSVSMIKKWEEINYCPFCGEKFSIIKSDIK